MKIRLRRGITAPQTLFDHGKDYNENHELRGDSSFIFKVDNG